MSTIAARPLLRDLLLTSRPLSWINTAFGFAAAYVLTTGRIDAAFVIGTLFFLVPYNLTMYGINDVFDYASDLANPRKGGAEGAVLSPARHRAVLAWSVLLPVPFVVALVLLGDPLSWLVLAISLFAVVAYSAPGLRFKEIPFLDSATSSVHFVSPAVYGLVLARATPTVPLVVLLLAFFAWGVASHAFGAVQDVIPDREAGISSIATVLGARWTVRFALALWALAGVLMLFTAWPGPLGAALAIPYIVAVWPFRGVTDADSAATNRGWRRFLLLNYVCGFLATMLLIGWAALGGSAF
ncbi:prenyltransferase [uncultured Microbacterium sp.]|uniref:prenyltransferase n=1 Tax=uncultured Microbacterium sp. TaxID=191216 RepID=UPI0025F7F586|nr:prenyltransferase [uncultured Microbacterium sp.]